MCQLSLLILAICFSPEVYGLYILYAISLRFLLKIVIYKLPFPFLNIYFQLKNKTKKDNNKVTKQISSYPRQINCTSHWEAMGDGTRQTKWWIAAWGLRQKTPFCNSLLLGTGQLLWTEHLLYVNKSQPPEFSSYLFK